MLGFEYGYSTAEPNTLVAWEAQFGDFVNGAQVVIDQFISSGEVKWGRVSGLDDAAAARLRRAGSGALVGASRAFPAAVRRPQHAGLQPTTPAQIFHLLRRQMIRLFRKPLIILTPKSLLRHKEPCSDLHELAKGAFQTVIPAKPTTHRSEEGQARHRLLRQGLLRPAPPRASERERHGDRPHRAALSVPAQGVLERDEEVPTRDRSRLVPGRAAEPGRVVPDPAQPAREHRRQRRSCRMPAGPLRRRRRSATTRSTTSSRRR